MNPPPLTSSPEPLIPLTDAGRLPWLPRAISVPTMFRYVSVGLRGRKLQAVRAAGRLCTTESWLLAFFEATGSGGSDAGGGGPGASRSPARRTLEHQRAEAALDRAGLA